MGRIAAYLGPRTPVAGLLETAPSPGFGVGWYLDDGIPEPVSLSSTGPSLPLLSRLRAEAVIAQLGVEGLAQPFVHGRYLFAHEGRLDRFDEVFARRLRERLGDEAYAIAEGKGASGLLFATWLDALGRGEGPDAMAGALERMVETVQRVGHEARAAARFAVVVSDGRCLVTLRLATDGQPPPLHTLVADDGSPLPASGRLVASEPLFPGAWTSLEPNSLIIFAAEP